MRILIKLSIILMVLSIAINVNANDKIYKQVFYNIKKCDWNNAESSAKQLQNTALNKIILSQKFLDPNYCASFKEITDFLEHSPNWPQAKALRLRAESLINESSDQAQVYRWLKKYPPQTANGYKYYALTSLKFVKDPASITSIIKEGWIYGNFKDQEQSDYYSKFKKDITGADNVRRIDNLLWRGSVSLAKKDLNQLNIGYRKSFEVQMAFLNSDHNAKKLFKKVPKEYYTSGLIYQYINACKLDLPSSKEVVGLTRSIKQNSSHGNEFWKIQNYLVREYIERKHFIDAYNVSSNHFAVSSANISEAEFLAGWIALRHINKPKLAIKHFTKFSKVVKTPMSVSRGLYWLARAHDADGNNLEAKKLYEHAAHKFGHTFYGQVATMELGEKKLRLPPKITLANHRDNKHSKGNDLTRACGLVSKYGSNGLVRTYLDDAVSSTTHEEEILAIALQMQHSNVHHKVLMSKNAIQKHVFIEHFSYPKPYKTSQLPIEEALTYGIIRQESVFDQFAVSSANAMGLMQLIKPTACDTAKKISLKCDISNLTKDINYNVTLGSHHLAHAIENYQNSYILAIASYNAGPGNVNKWLKIYGDPRQFKNVHKVIDWIEVIPFAETRNYVQRVLENVQIYRALSNKDAKFKLRDDLMRI